jgi:hypothetical protein
MKKEAQLVVSEMFIDFLNLNIKSIYEEIWNQPINKSNFEYLLINKRGV